MANMRLSAAAPSCEPAIFSFNNSHLRIFDREGAIWFLAKDVVVGLDLANVTNALRELDDDELSLQTVKSGSQRREMRLISEPGFYKLVGRSRKPAAKRFDRWVRHEVLPTIRKTGGYQAAPAADDRRVDELIGIVGQFAGNQNFVTEDRFNQLVAVVNKMADAIVMIAGERGSKPRPKRITKPTKDRWESTIIEWADAQTEPFRLSEMFPTIAAKHGMSTDVSRRWQEKRITRILVAHGYDRRKGKPCGIGRPPYCWEKAHA